MRQTTQLIAFVVAGLMAASLRASGGDLILYRDSGAPAMSAEDGPEAVFQQSRKALDAGSMDPQAQAVLRAAETFTQEVFNVPTLQFRRAVSYRDTTGDILVAEWSISEPFGAGSILVQDTPYLSVYQLALSGCKIASKADLTAFLAGLLTWGKLPIGLTPGSLTVALQANAPRIDSFRAHPTTPFSAYEIVRDFIVLGYRDRDEWYVTVTIGKDFAVDYPVEPFVPERFPPLTELARGWGIDRIQSEFGKHGPYEGVDLSERRDPILAAELAKRGLPVEQYLDLFKADPGHRLSRLWAAIEGLRAEKIPLQPYIARALASYLQPGSGADEELVTMLFRYATDSCSQWVSSRAVKRPVSPEFEALALNTLRTGVFTEGPLAYLGACSSSQEALDALGSTPVPASAADAKESALRHIQRRLPKTKPQ